jgi:hypothetical protein
MAPALRLVLFVAQGALLPGFPPLARAFIIPRATPSSHTRGEMQYESPTEKIVRHMTERRAVESMGGSFDALELARRDLLGYFGVCIDMERQLIHMSDALFLESSRCERDSKAKGVRGSCCRADDGPHPGHSQVPAF